MQNLSLAGTWAGMIVYGSEYGIREGEELYFRVELSQEENWFSGTSADIGGFGASPDPADISGIIVETKVYFIKRYRSLHSLSDLHDDEAVVDRSEKGHEIYYSGTFNEPGDIVEGEWGFRAQLGPGSAIPVSAHAGSGTWIMKRK